MTNSIDLLPWRIEAFREYITYETLQPTAAVLKTFEGELFTTRNSEIIRMQKLLQERTGKNAWLPNRSGSSDINWNVEGDVTRNKGRVFTSMLILHPKDWVENKIKLTKFGNALAAGEVSKEEFYFFILSNFQYPHPAWKDNWDAWTKAGKHLLPFVYLLQTLICLYESDPNEAYLSTEEVADYLHSKPDHLKALVYTKNIIKGREGNSPPIVERSDQVHRKISDLLGFLCLTKFCYFNANKVFLNMIDQHHDELVFFNRKRKGQDKLLEVKQLISDALNNASFKI